jgi:hypothetical protein
MNIFPKNRFLFFMLFLSALSLSIPVRAEANFVCSSDWRKVKIIVAPQSEKVFIKNNVDVETLGRQGAYSPYDKGAKTETLGLTATQYKYQYQSVYQLSSWPALNKGCVYYDQINVALSLDPIIYIASRFPPGSCRYNATLLHERKHVAVDRMIVNDYSRYIGQAIQQVLMKMPPSYVSIDVAQIPLQQEKLNNLITRTVDPLIKRMQQDREYRQRQIDTVGEYNYISGLCPK